MKRKGDNYILDEINLVDLTNKYGAPLYVYSSNTIKSKFNSLKKAFSTIKNVKINYACKALTNISILKLLNNMGSGLDTVSIQEVELGIMAGFSPKDIIYTPNGVAIDEYEKAVNLGVKINIDNIDVLEQFGEKYPDYPISIRINPHIMGGGNAKISVGHIDSKFGISIYQLPHIKKIVEANKTNVEGVHMHTGSDILDIETFVRAADVLFNVAKEFDSIKYIDFGSGFKVPYREGDIYTDIDLLGKKLGDKFNSFCKEYNRDVTIMFEPGKFLVSEAGYFLTKVNVVKQTPANLFAGVDSGQNHFIRPMFYDAYHDIVNLSNPEGSFRFYTVVGYICETDTFGSNRRLNEIAKGDILCFKNAGAYCFSMSSNYNSRYRPAEVLIYNGKDYLIRERETMEDLTRNQVEIDL